VHAPGGIGKSTLCGGSRRGPRGGTSGFSRPIGRTRQALRLRLRRRLPGDLRQDQAVVVVDSAELCHGDVDSGWPAAAASHDHPARQSRHTVLARAEFDAAVGEGAGGVEPAGVTAPERAGRLPASCLARYRSGPRLGRRAGLPPLP